jgi:alpha-tubulin suppressor-like RCC1 family protein
VGGVAKSGAVSILGDLDVGPPSKATKPRPVAALSHVVAMAAGASHWCALREAGDVLCWGGNAAGQVGAGAPSGLSTSAKGNELYGGPTVTGRSAPSPVRVPDVANAVQIAAGNDHTCALLRSGKVQCWGDASRGQDGPDSSGGPAAREVRGLGDVAQIALGAVHSCARTADGAVRCWGDNTKGQLGTGAPSSRAQPEAVPGIDHAVYVAAGGHHTCALEASGSVRCWGDGRPAPALVTGLDPTVALSAGAEHTCALGHAGVVDCWGRGQGGQLGCGGECPFSSRPRRIAW